MQVDFLCSADHRSGYPDKLCGVFTEYAERAGWHLRGYDASTWSTCPSLALDGAGVGFFVANIGRYTDGEKSWEYRVTYSTGKFPSHRS